MSSTTRYLAALAAALLAACGDRPPASEVAEPHAGHSHGPLRSFVNGDFEGGTLAGWTLATYLNPGLAVAPPTLRSQLNLAAGGGNLTRVVTGATESVLPAGLTAGSTLRLPKYGSNAVVVNELGASRNVNGIKQAMTVTNADVDPNDNKAHVRFALAPVLQNPSHTAVQQPYFWITLTNTTKGLVLFYTFNYSNQAGVPWKSDPVNTTTLYTDWQSFDISPGAAQLAVGDSVELEIIAAGCSLGGHYGHVYLDGIAAYLPGLGVAATAPASVNTGSTLTYTFRYSNNGIDAAPNTTITEVLPAGTTFASLSAPGASCTTPAVGGTGSVVCNVGTVNPASSGSFTVTVNVTAAAGATVSNGNYTIAATSVSPLIGPLVTTSVTSGVTYADLATTASDGVAAVNWGATTTYAVAVRNNGPSAANGAAIAVPVPANVAAFTGWTCAATGGAACGVASGSGAIATTANLPSGGQVTYTVTAAVAAGSGASTISLQATASTPAGVTDSNPSNNVAVDYDQVGTLRTLTLTKTGGGTGTVLSSPAAISCGTACAGQSAVFLDGTSVALTASTAAGSRFTGWTAGPCAGSTAPGCVVPLTADTTVTADFLAGDWLVTGSAPGGNGTVSCTSPVLNGQPSSCAIAPAARHRLTALTDNGASVLGSVSGGSYLIASVTADHAVVGTFTANTASVALAAAPASPSTWGQAVTFTATATAGLPAGTPTGTVTFLDGATTLCAAVPLVGGVATCTSSTLAVASHSVTASSSGDATYPPATSAAVAYTVGKATAAVTLGALAQTYDGTPRAATAATTPAGLTVALTYDGSATPPTAAGSYAVVATVVDASYQGSTSGTLVIGKATAAVTLGALAQTYDGTPRAATAATTPAGLTVALTYDGSATPPTAAGSSAVVATVVDANYQGSASGTLVVGKATAAVTLGALAQTYDGTPRAATAATTPAGLTVTLTYGGSATPPTAAGSHAVVATVVDANYQGSASGTLVVARAAPGVALASSANPSVFTQGVTLTVTVTGAGATPTGSVTFADGGTTLCGGPVLLSGGSATCATGALAVASHALTASYAGDASYLAGVGSLTQVVNAAATTTTLAASTPSPVYGQAMTLTATVAPVAPGGGTPAGAVAFTEGATTWCAAAPLSGGVATCLLPTTLAVGSHTFTAGYQGSTSHAASTSADLGRTVGQAASSVAMATSGSPSTHGDAVTFTATVAGPGATPTGSVTFTAGATTLCGGPVALVAGAATCTTPALAAGSHLVTGTYGGDASYQAASAFVAQLVEQAAAAVVATAAPSPATFGAAVTLSATVSGPGATPGGTVVFAEGGTTLCSATLSGGVASCTSAPLAVATHLVDAQYGGDANHLPAASSVALTVDPAAAAVALGSAPNPSSHGSGVTFTATVTGPGGTPTGQVTFSDGATTLCGGPRPLTAGTASCTTTALAAGAHAITAAYGGSTSHLPAASAPLAQVVNQVAPTVAVATSGSPSVYGSAVTFTATLSGPGAVPTGAVTFTDGALTLCSGPVAAVAGVATCTTSVLLRGTHVVAAAYGGDSNYLPASGSRTQVVTPADPTLALLAAPSPSVFGEDVALSVTVSGAGVTPTGTVTLTEGVTTLCGGPIALVAGVATCHVATLATGDHLLVASYSGDDNYGTGSPAARLHTVGRALTEVALEVAPATTVFGEPIVLTATVTVPAPGAGSPGGTVDFYDGATLIGTAVVDPVTGLATLTIPPGSPLAVGDHDFTVTYSGDPDFQGALSPAIPTFSIGQASTLVTVTPSRNPAVFGETITFTFEVTAVAPGAGTPTGTLTVVLDGASFDLALVGGSATYQVNDLGIGPHGLLVDYLGDASFLPSSGSHAQTVDPSPTTVAAAASPAPSVFGQPVAFTATVSAASPGSGTPTGTVTLLEGATPLASGPLDAGGQATLTVASLPVGAHALTLAYGGDATFLPSAAPLAHDVQRAFTDTALVASALQTVYGAPVTFSATVTPAFFGVGAPTGTVDFLDGGNVLQTVAVDPAGHATFTTSSLAPGLHLVVAAYSGDQGFLDSASLPATTDVLAAPVTVALVTGPNPSAFGELATWTVRVVADAPSVAVPDGTIELLDGAAVIDTLTLDATGQAGGASAALAVGAHPLTARLLASPRFGAATSPGVTHQVLKAQTSVALQASPSPSLFGSPVTLSARVSVASPGAGQPTGTVTFSDGAQVLGSGPVDATGLASLTLTTLATGDHQLTAGYAGDASFAAGASAPLLHVVTPAATAAVASVSPSPSVYGQPVTFSVTVTSPAGVPTGRVDFLENGVALLGSDLLGPAGQASFTTTALAIGSHAVVARYAGATDYQQASAPPVSAVVQPASTTTTLAAGPSPAVSGQPVTLTAAVAVVAPGGGVPSGTVTFMDGATVLGTATIDPATGLATLVVATLPVGDHALTASYPGDGRYAGSASGVPLSLQVAQADVAVAVTTTPGASVVGEPVTIGVAVTAAPPGAGTPTGQVTLADGATTLGTVILVGGAGQLTTALPVGDRTLTASYGGDAAFLAGVGSHPHTVARASTQLTLATSGGPSTFGEPVTLTATVRPVAPGAGSPGGTVTFSDGATVLGAGPVGPGGVASLATTALPAGLRSLSASYGGDASFTGSQGTATQEVLRAGVAVAVVASPSPAVYGEPVVVTVTLTTPIPGAGAPVGTVTLLDGGTPVGTVTVDAGGVATFTLTAPSAGVHVLTASYPGALGFTPASGGGSLTVAQGTTTLALASSRNPSRAGRAVTFTATATSEHATPAGTVTFKDGDVVLGAAPLSGGVARLTTRALKKGLHAVTADLAASADFGAGSAALPGGQLVENTPPVAGSGTALLLGPGRAVRAAAAAAGALDQPVGTVELWTRATWTAPDQAGPTPTLARLGDGAAARWALGVTPERTGLTVTLGDTTTTVPADLSDGAWHQVALLAGDASATLLLDGREVGALDGHFGAAAGQSLTVGDGFTGELDELRLWSTTRTAAAVAGDARRPLRASEPGLLGYWRMDDGEGLELLDAGPAGLDLAAEPDAGGAPAAVLGDSAAWRFRVAQRERPMAPIDAGYDADGDPLTLAVTGPPTGGTASVDAAALQVGYLGADGFSGLDALTFRLTDDEGATGDYTVAITVERILACTADADCSGGDACVQGACVAPHDLAARAGGCGCSSGGGEALALWSLLALGLTTRRRPRRAAPQAGRQP